MRSETGHNPAENTSRCSKCYVGTYFYSYFRHYMKYFWYSFSKFGVKTPLPMFSLISSLVQNLPPANSSWLGVRKPIPFPADSQRHNAQEIPVQNR